MGALDKIGGYTLECRGEISIKGKGLMKTWWLHGRPGQQQQQPTCTSPPPPPDPVAAPTAPDELQPTDTSAVPSGDNSIKRSAQKRSLKKSKSKLGINTQTSTHSRN